MQCFQQNYILVQANPYLSLDEFVLAIVFARISRGEAKVVVSRRTDWSDFDQLKLVPQSYLVVPAIVLASFEGCISEPLIRLSTRIKERDLSLFEFTKPQLSKIEELSVILLANIKQYLIEEEKDLNLCTSLSAIAMALLDDEDSYLEPLLDDSYFLLEKAKWGEPLTTLWLESTKSERNDGQWTRVVNRFAIADM